MYGLKGLCAYAHHAGALGFSDKTVFAFVAEALRCVRLGPQCANGRLGPTHFPHFYVLLCFSHYLSSTLSRLTVFPLRYSLPCSSFASASLTHASCLPPPTSHLPFLLIFHCHSSLLTSAFSFLAAPESSSVEACLAMALRVGETNMKVMAMLSQAHRSS